MARGVRGTGHGRIVSARRECAGKRKARIKGVAKTVSAPLAGERVTLVRSTSLPVDRQALFFSAIASSSRRASPTSTPVLAWSKPPGDAEFVRRDPAGLRPTAPTAACAQARSWAMTSTESRFAL